MKKSSKGTGTRYDQPDAVEEKERQRSPGIGAFNNFICVICGKQKGRYVNHKKCSKIMQEKHIKEKSAQQS